MNKHVLVVVLIVLALGVGFFIVQKKSGEYSSTKLDETSAPATATSAPEYATLEVADGVYSFGNGSVFSMFVVSDTSVLVVDPINANHSGLLLKAIREVTELPVTYLVYSHNHWDHESGGAVFKDAGATVLSHVDARDWLLENPNPEVVIPDEVWSGSKREIVLGNKTIELHHFGRSHGEGMTVTLLPEEKIAFIVDIVTPDRVGFTILPDFYPREWERTLSEIEKLDFEIALFGHKTARGTKADVTAVREYIQDLRAEVFAMLQNGESFLTLADNLELPKYKDWEFYDEWLHMNAWRMLMEVGIGW